MPRLLGGVIGSYLGYTFPSLSLCSSIFYEGVVTTNLGLGFALRSWGCVFRSKCFECALPSYSGPHPLIEQLVLHLRIGMDAIRWFHEGDFPPSP